MAVIKPAVIAAFLLAEPSLVSDAKCPFVTFKFSGKVQDARSGTPLTSAVVHAFIDDSQETKNAGRATGGADGSRTDQAGKFEIQVIFNTYSGGAPLDECNHEAKRVEVIVAHEGHETRRERFTLSKLSLSSAAPEEAFALPTLKLKPAKRRK